MIYNNNDQLVNELKKVMIDTNTKQVELANMMEVPKQEITKIFNKKNLTCDDMQKLLLLMGMSCILILYRWSRTGRCSIENYVLYC